MIDLDAPSPPRLVAAGTVLLLHVVLVGALAAGGVLSPVLRAVVPARLIIEHVPPPAPPPIPLPQLAEPPAVPVPAPDIRLATPERPPIPRVVRPVPAAGAAHFGASIDTGLGLDVATASGGGAGTRGTLAGFEAAVRARVLARRQQPTLAWDRRNTCIINYTVHVAGDGSLAGLTIAPCAVQEINEAARQAIRDAAPFPRPPDLGAGNTDVHGSLIFRP